MKSTKKIGALFLLVTISLITLYPCLSNDFVNWDDDKYVLENRDIQALTGQNIGKIFSSFYCGAYVPLTVLSFAIDYQIGVLNTLIYHRTNLLLHFLNSILIFWVVYLFCKKTGVSFLTALFFTIHPLHVEPVAWVTGRKDLLYALFFTGSVIAYLYFRTSDRRQYYLMSFLLFILALFSKPAAVTLPFVLLVIEYFVYSQSNKKSLIRMAPYLILSIIFFYIAVIAQRTAGAFPQGKLNFLQQINISLSNFLFYLYKMIVPIKLSCIYPIQNYWFAPFLVGAIIIVILISLRYNRIIALTMVFFVIMMLPVLQLIPVGQILSDRYTYLSLTGFFYLLAAALYTLYLHAKKKFRIFIIIIVLLITVFLSTLSNKQCRIWKDGMTLWTYVINTYPDISVAYNNRGTIHSNNRNYTNALEDYNKALQINPKYVKVYVHRGNVFNNLGDFDRALSDYNKALKIDSTCLIAYHNRAVLYYNNKNYEHSLKDFLRIRELGGEVPDDVINYLKDLLKKDNQ